jgi:hypothetical protein
MSGPSDRIGGLSTSVIAGIAVGGVAGLIGLVVIIAMLLDLPKRMKEKKNKHIMAAEEMEKKSIDIDDLEKGAVKQSTNKISTGSQSPTTSTHVDRPASPECQCAHPSIVIHPSPVYSNTSTMR